MTDEQDDLPPSYYAPSRPPTTPGDDDIPFPSPEAEQTSPVDTPASSSPIEPTTPVDTSTLPEKPSWPGATEMAWPETVKFTIEVESQTIAFLAVMAAGEGGDPIERASSTLQDFFDVVDMGIRNRGSWERGWLVRAFTDAWVDRLEVDPADPVHMRVKETKVE